MSFKINTRHTLPRGGSGMCAHSRDSEEPRPMQRVQRAAEERDVTYLLVPSCVNIPTQMQE